jgi:nucleotide-binding universal stress UspA family protein
MTTSCIAPGYVLLGVGSSPAAAAAARWAAAEAVRRGVALYAVRVVPATPGQGDLAEARRRTPARVGDWLADAPVVPVLAVRVTSGDVATELQRHAVDAGVVVLGSPTTGRTELPRVVAGGCPGALVVVDAEGHAHQIASARATWSAVPVGPTALGRAG